ncbi:Glutamyl- and glutaminyl-tRNA synthetase [Rubrobacter radiotolerans]|uniref:Glutamate--tRNA ligase n=1 Tax=Rubrobacter radiotolerans TaxID=42256 RepID=A0A023X598_RUBRA|nr:glutamate--tRNA ligase family protein [Rubrobacter radiotolerans]AHY47244.1 Glutamyl- and glutaminyl-tRNA synthetase [Rubrobacter radiotolerans]MDX5894648.1 glutamate--tRNA ligase family protein [Rubrobacter radiotolerans]SMC06470.1 nondiscriminating glutamyl-tRNA synthetase [Rubrobacter radiotolerans DSM 5868]
MSASRLRFAPSPTGSLHPGGARTALFNYLFARHTGGEVFLRIEDTDRLRSERRHEESLLRDLDWLGLTFSGEPVRQSERDEVYEECLERLREAGLVYRRSDEAGRVASYLRVPERGGTFRDALRGEVSFARVEDFVLVKSDGSPAYNFACVADDLAMGITHVLRGEEHLPNTARQAILYRALGEREPEFLHPGVILAPDGKKLSKRHGAVSVGELRERGFLPEALVNGLALLGWNHPEGREFFPTLRDLEREWDPDRLGASPATFSVERLLSLNAEHLRNLPAEELCRRLEPFLDGPLPAGRELIAVEMLREDLRTLADALELLRAVTGPVAPGAFVRELPASSERVFERVLASLGGRDLRTLEAARELVGELRRWAKGEGLTVREVLHPLRLALTGRDRGPELAYVLAALGAEEARARVEAARRELARGRDAR